MINFRRPSQLIKEEKIKQTTLNSNDSMITIRYKFLKNYTTYITDLSY